MAGTALTLQLLPHLQHPTPELPGWTLVANLLQGTLVLDMGGWTLPVTWADLRAWDLDFHDAWDAAAANLRARSSPAHWRATSDHGLYRYQGSDTEGAARMFLLPELVRPWPQGGVLFGLPTSGLLIALPLEDHLDLVTVPSLVAACALSHSAASHPLTNQLLWTGGEHVRLVPVLRSGGRVAISPPDEVTEAMAHLVTQAPVASAAEA